VENSLKRLESDSNVEFVVPVFKEPKSGLRLVATDEITVRFKKDASQSSIDDFNRDNDVEVIKQNSFVPQQYLLRVKNAKDTLTTADKYQQSDLTEFAEPNFSAEIKKAALPNDLHITQQWHLKNTRQGNGKAGEDVAAEKAWKITTGSKDITIAIIDDGVDIDHPDLKDNIWKNPDPNAPDINGKDFYDGSNNPRPKKFTPPYHRLQGNDSHGTPCAGVAAAVGDNHAGVAGIAYACKILPVKIFLADALAPLNKVADAIRYAGQKADVLSNSWGISPSSNVEQAIKDVVQYGRGGKGCPVFVATGNDHRSYIGFPASVPEAIAVGASTNQGRRSSYSNYGQGIDFVAPSSGGSRGIFTTDVSYAGRGFNVGDVGSGDAEGLYTNSFGGTSSATPLAAGIAALILSKKPELKWDEVRRLMRETADKIDRQNGGYTDGYSLQYGYGRVNAHKALKALKENGGGDGRVIEKNVSPALAIPDKNPSGIHSPITIDEQGAVDAVEALSVDIAHTYRGDLLVSLIAPGSEAIVLHGGQGGGAHDLVETYNTSNTPALEALRGKGIHGTWQLKVVDQWADDTGTLNSWGLKIRTQGNTIKKSHSPGTHIPDDDPQGITSVINLPENGTVKDIKVGVNISHTYIGDLQVKLISPANTVVLLHNREGGDVDNLREEYNSASHPPMAAFVNEEIKGDWVLSVSDNYGDDTGKLNQWEIEIALN
jgi:subtilisin-like proprotein convertase family protein